MGLPPLLELLCAVLSAIYIPHPMAATFLGPNAVCLSSGGRLQDPGLRAEQMDMGVPAGQHAPRQRKR